MSLIDRSWFVPLYVGGYRLTLHYRNAVPPGVRRGPKVEQWANGWLIGFRRTFVIVVPIPRSQR